MFNVQEEEEEEEEEVVKENAKKKKYSRDGENPVAWRVESLSRTMKDADASFEARQRAAQELGESVQPWYNYFYPATEFAVKNYVFSKGT